jgi:fucose permease
MKTIFKFAVARLGEVSTYKGAVFLLTAAGAAIRPELAAAITSVGLAVAGLLGVLTADPVPDAQ